MNAPLSPEDRTRLAKLLALLSSPHAGERDAAGLAAERLVKARGLTWEDVLQPTPVPDRPAMTWRAPEPAPTHYQLVEWCLGRGGFLTKWERDFLRGLVENGWCRRLSRKQQGCLDDIVRKIRVEMRGEVAA